MCAYKFRVIEFIFFSFTVLFFCEKIHFKSLENLSRRHRHRICSGYNEKIFPKAFTDFIECYSKQ